MPTDRPLLDLRMANGCRHFGDLPETYDVERPQWYALRDHVAQLAGASDGRMITDDVTEAWIDFDLAGHHFSINDQHGRWWFFVDDPTCPDELLRRVLDHFEARLDPPAWHARGAGPIAPGHHRSLVLEADGRVTTRDFADLASARRHADDAAWETGDGPVVAYVLDEHFDVVHRPRR